MTVMTLDQLKVEVLRLSPQEQLKLVSHITQYLSAEVASERPLMTAEALKRRRKKKADELMSMLNEVAEMWDSPIDSVEEIKIIRQERDEQLWPSKS